MKTEYFAAPEIKSLTEHSRALGWYSQADWECFLRTGVVFGHRLKSNEIVSSAYLSNFENKVGWLGAVIVNSRFQGKKLGRDLIEKALSIAPDDDFVLALIATERGKKMYEHAGFIEIGNTHKFVIALDAQAPANNDGVRAFEEKDFDAINSLDAAAIGYKRTKLLRERLSASEACVFEDQSGDVSGFIFASKDGERISLGPIVAPTIDIALLLLRAAVAGGGAFRLDIPHWQSGFIRGLDDLGFKLSESALSSLTKEGPFRPFQTAILRSWLKPSVDLVGICQDSATKGHELLAFSPLPKPSAEPSEVA